MKFNEVYENRKIMRFVREYAFQKYNTSPLRADMGFDDFNQLCLINIHKRIVLFDKNKCSIQGFLSVIINSTFLHEIRRINQKCRDIEIRKETLSLDLLGDDGITLGECIPNELTLEDEMEKNIQSNLILKCFKLLQNDRDKKVLSLMYDGYNPKDIQRILELKSRTSVVQSIGRIKKQLEKIM